MDKQYFLMKIGLPRKNVQILSMSICVYEMFFENITLKDKHIMFSLRLLLYVFTKIWAVKDFLNNLIDFVFSSYTTDRNVQ